MKLDKEVKKNARQVRRGGRGRLRLKGFDSMNLNVIGIQGSGKVEQTKGVARSHLSILVGRRMLRLQPLS